MSLFECYLFSVNDDDQCSPMWYHRTKANLPSFDLYTNLNYMTTSACLDVCQHMIGCKSATVISRCCYLSSLNQGDQDTQENQNGYTFYEYVCTGQSYNKYICSPFHCALRWYLTIPLLLPPSVNNGPFLQHL